MRAPWLLRGAWHGQERQLPQWPEEDSFSSGQQGASPPWCALVTVPSVEPPDASMSWPASQAKQRPLPAMTATAMRSTTAIILLSRSGRMGPGYTFIKLNDDSHALLSMSIGNYPGPANQAFSALLCMARRLTWGNFMALLQLWLTKRPPLHRTWPECGCAHLGRCRPILKNIMYRLWNIPHQRPPVLLD